MTPRDTRDEVIELLEKAIKLNAADALDYSESDEAVREALALLRAPETRRVCTCRDDSGASSACAIHVPSPPAQTEDSQ